MRRHLPALAAAIALTVLAAAAWAYWSAGSVPGGNGASAATSVNQGPTPNASASGSTVTVSWTASTLANGQPVSGYLVKRYDAATSASQTVLSACAGTITATSCVESGVPNGSWKYSVTPLFATSWQGPESARSATVVVNTDGIPPTNAITLSSVTGGVHLVGTALYYRGAAAGSFRLTNAVSDAGSGPASSATAALTGTTGGWTHSPSTVSSPAGGPYVSNPFSWTAGSTSSPSETVTGRDVAGNTATTTLTFTNDSTAPTAGSISYADGFTSGRSATITFTSGTDSGSGIATRRLQRAGASLTNGTCGTFGAFLDVGSDNPTSPYTDGSLGAGCFKYRYVVTDRVGNQDVATNGNVVKVGYAGAVNATPGLLSHWRLGDDATPAAVVSDSFTDTAGRPLTAHTGELAAAWTRQDGTADATISNEGRIYRSSLFGGYTVNTAAKPLVNADYSVEADLVLKTRVNSDMVGVVGRLTGSGTHYAAVWQESDNSWKLLRFPVPFLGTSELASLTGQPDLVTGQAYRLKLEMVGSALRLYVDGVLKVSATDTSITAPGLAGIVDGNRDSVTNPTKDNATGIHLDNFQVTSSYRARDSKGTNHGAYANGTIRRVAGALAGDTDTAASFDGVNDHVQMTATTGFPTGAAVRSTELWFKTTSAARQVLFRYGSGAATQEYGLWLNAGGTTMTAWGHSSGNDKTFTMPYALNDGAWHHVVKTFNGSVLTLYIDGAALPAQAATRNTVMDTHEFAIGAVLRTGDTNSGGYFQGSIDEVSFYTSVLTQAQVTDHYQLGAAPAVDGAGPTGGSVDATGLVGTGARYATGTTLSLALAKGTDPSGLAPSGHQLLRASATLTDGTCGGYGTYTPVATDPTSPLADAVGDQGCYRYRYVVSDTLGNATTHTSPDIKVDTTAPAAPALAFSNLTNTHASGSTVYYRSAATSGSLTVTATASDVSGVASYSLPTLGTGWTATPGAPGVTTYSWSAANPAAPGTRNVTATNNAGLTSPDAPLTFTADDAAPTAGTVGYPNTSQSGTLVAVTFTTGTDDGSGVGTRLLQRASAPMAGTSCGTYGAFATVSGGTNPTSPFTDTVATGQCHKYQYVVSDNVGNVTTASSSNVVKVAAACGSQLLVNPGFENGTAPWTASPGVVTTGSAKSGTYKALLGGNGIDTTETVEQTVTIPANCSATLTYWLRVTTSETSHPWDFFRVQVNGTTLQTFSDSDATDSYVQRTVDLSPYAGQTITLRFLSDEDGSIVSSFLLDDVSVTTAAISQQSYADAVNATPGLISQYRLGGTTLSSDAMAGATGATLQSRTGEVGASWTRHAVSDADAVLTDAGRLRKAGTGSFGALYYTSATPASADYTVEADIHVRSNLAGDMAGVVGRLAEGNAAGTYYVARYEQQYQKWILYKRVSGSWQWLGESATQVLSEGTTYRLALDLAGTTIRVLVDGVQQFSVTDSAISGPGRGGVSLGLGAAGTSVTNAAGFHVDNVRISPKLIDSKGTNHGTWLGGATLGVDGAISGDSNTAATFDGVNDFGSVTRQISEDFSIELWFRSTQGIGTGSQWWSGAGLVDAEVDGTTNDFGVSLRSDGRVLAGVGGTADVSVVSSSGGYNNGAWHHVVFTRSKATGTLTLYVDGAAVGTATGSTLSLTSAPTVNIGRIQTGLNHLAGSIDEVALYNTALSAATVSAHYAAAS